MFQEFFFFFFKRVFGVWKNVNEQKKKREHKIKINIFKHLKHSEKKKKKKINYSKINLLMRRLGLLVMVALVELVEWTVDQADRILVLTALVQRGGGLDVLVLHDLLVLGRVKRITRGEWLRPLGSAGLLLELLLLLLVRPTVLVAVVHVLAVGARMRESFATLAALKRLLASVQPLVLSEVMLVLEGFVARVAHERPYARVFVLVARQRRLLAEHFVALVACVHVTALDHVVLP